MCELNYEWTLQKLKHVRVKAVFCLIQTRECKGFIRMCEKDVHERSFFVCTISAFTFSCSSFEIFVVQRLTLASDP